MPRLFRNHPGYIALSTFVLAVSIGVNLVFFTVVNALWLRPLPFPEAERVVTFPGVRFGFLDHRMFGIFEGGVAGQVVTDDDLGGMRPQIEITGIGQDIETLAVTSGYFQVLHLTIRGRDLAPDDDRDDAEPVAIISDRFWTRAFGRRAEVIGAVLPTKPLPIRIVGIAPKNFQGARRGERADLWIPSSLVRRLAPAEWSRIPSMMVFARLGPQQSVATTQRRLASMEPNIVRDFQTTVTPLTEVFGTPQSPTSVIREGSSLLIVSALAMLVLLGGCVTIAALVLMHYERRRGELAIKMSLGAGRSRLVLELTRDLSFLAATGSAGGVLVAIVGTHLVPAFSLPGGLNIGRLDLSIDWRVCAVAIVATVVTFVLAAALPLARATRLGLAGQLLAGASATTLGSVRVRQVLLAVQVCSTVIVLIGAGLFVRAVMRGFGTAAGFDIDRTVFVSIQEPAPRNRPAGDPRPLIVERAGRLMPALGGLSGVSEVAEGISPIGPEAMGSLSDSRTVRVEGRGHQLPVGVLRGSPNLLSALGVRLLAGRALTAADSDAAPPHPAVITRSLAERLWPGGSGLGQTVTLPELRGGSLQVVGIAADLVFGSLRLPAHGVVVTAGPGNSSIVSTFVIRTDHPDIVSNLAHRTFKGQVRVTTGRETIARDIGRQRLGAWFFSGFGLAALVLGVGGAFGLVAYLAESRRREFGVRLALGATLANLVWHSLFAALAPVSAGIVVGVALGGIISQLFEALLVGISALDAVTYLAVAVIILGCTTIAALAAAWRLRRTTPAEALRAT